MNLLAVEDSPLVLSLTDPRVDRATAGGKAGALAELARAGFPVPEGVVVTADAFEAFIASAQLQEELTLLGDAMDPDRPAPDEAVLAAIRARVRAAPAPLGLRGALTAALGSSLVEHRPFAVRSSASAEDLAEASFAGLYESFLNVRGDDAVERAIKKCWASLWHPRVIDYVRRQGSRRLPSMPVLVQRLVEAEVSGVVFTTNPVTGVDDEAMVEAVFGLGEPLVSGRAPPDRYVADLWRGTLRSIQLAVKPARAVAIEDGGIREESLTPQQSRARTLEAEPLRAVVALAAAVHEHAGRPVDVEFAIEDGQVQLLQARPITQILFAPALGEWTTANFREGGVAASECTRLMSSLYERAFNASMQAYLAGLKLVPERSPTRWLRTFFGRPYWNFGEVKRAIATTPGFVERNFDLDLGIPATYAGSGRSTPLSLRAVLRSLRTVVALDRGYARNLAQVREFVSAFPRRRAPFERKEGALAELTDRALAQGLRALFDGLHQATETLYFTTVYNLSNAKLELSLSLAQASRRSDAPISYPRLVGGLRDVSHLRPLRELHGLAAILRAEDRRATPAEVSAFAERWPHKGRRELDLREPRWSEDLEQIHALIDEACAADGLHADPDVLAEHGHRDYLQEKSRAEAVLGAPSRWLFRRRLSRVRDLSWWREELRDCSTHVYLLVRRWTLEAGRRLAERDVISVREEALNFSVEELLSSLSGHLSDERLRELGSRRARELRAFRNFPAPDQVGAAFPFRPGAQPVRRMRRSELQAESRLSGTASSPGVVEGLARVVRTMAEARALLPGEILVAPFTDPGWTPALARCAAVVTEAGGLLSHAAVISREYGIPAVLAVPGVTTLVRTGQRLRVDGDSGRVEVAA